MKSKEEKKLILNNIKLLIVFLLILLVVFLFSLPYIGTLLGGQFGPIFDTPSECPGSRWYASDIKAEILVPEEGENNSIFEPIIFNVNGEKRKYYLKIKNSPRIAEVFKSEDGECILSGQFDTGYNKFVIKRYDCYNNDLRESLKEYDEIVFYKD